MNKFDIINWNLSKIIILNRNRFFFRHVNCYFQEIKYQIDVFCRLSFSNERLEWTHKSNHEDYFSISFRRNLWICENLLAKICKKFSSKLNFENHSSKHFFFIDRIRVKIANFIIFVQMNTKHNYDKNYQSLFMKIDDYALLRLHRDYEILFIVRCEFKFN